MIYGQPVTFGGASGEIVITDNGTFDVKKYATANVNVAPELVWTNAQIGVAGATFAAQTLTFNGESDGYLVEAAVSSETDPISGTSFWSYRDTFFIPVGADSSRNVMAQANSKTGSAPVCRGFGVVTNNSIVFNDGYRNGVNNKYVIPTRIWGVKFTL